MSGGEKPEKSAFERAAARGDDEGLLAELFAFLKHNKKWWLVPIFVVLLVLGLLIVLSGTAAAPFIYTLF
jgi:predicted amidophosphoribosyltransferase